jgi:hypothetical protein
LYYSEFARLCGFGYNNVDSKKRMIWKVRLGRVEDSAWAVAGRSRLRDLAYEDILWRYRGLCPWVSREMLDD